MDRLFPAFLRSVAVLSALVFTTALPADGRAETPTDGSAASFAEVEGDVAVVRSVDGEETLAEVDMELYEGDEIAVPAGAAATISFLDNHLLKLNERTTLTVKTVKAGSRAGSFWGRMWLKAGSLVAYLSGLTAEESGFEIETATAVAAVKGPTFAMETDGETSTISTPSATSASGAGAVPP